MFDTSNKPFIADGADAIFVYAHIIDASGITIWDADRMVKFTTNGPAQIIGPTEVKAEAGIATILLQATNQAGKIRISAESSGLPIGAGEIESVKNSKDDFKTFFRK